MDWAYVERRNKRKLCVVSGIHFNSFLEILHQGKWFLKLFIDVLKVTTSRILDSVKILTRNTYSFVPFTEQNIIHSCSSCTSNSHYEIGDAKDSPTFLPYQSFPQTDHF